MHKLILILLTAVAVLVAGCDRKQFCGDYADRDIWAQEYAVEASNHDCNQHKEREAAFDWAEIKQADCN